ncbi:hypothetical protein F5Y05DRAFT_374893 [Hypoxylon sp. FL0543]|nr:hypothetical protein F5Y05DRAFT_374893 [Hypoxylon sp. FL0543]
MPSTVFALVQILLIPPRESFVGLAHRSGSLNVFTSFSCCLICYAFQFLRVMDPCGHQCARPVGSTIRPCA